MEQHYTETFHMIDATLSPEIPTYRRRWPRALQRGFQQRLELLLYFTSVLLRCIRFRRGKMLKSALPSSSDSSGSFSQAKFAGKKKKRPKSTLYKNSSNENMQLNKMTGNVHCLRWLLFFFILCGRFLS